MTLTLTAINQQTEWFDHTAATSDCGYILEGDFQDPVSVHYSNKPGTKSVNDYIVDTTTYSTKTNLVVAFGTARFVRFASGGAWTGGKSCTARPGVALAGSQGFLIGVEGSTNIPTG